MSQSGSILMVSLSLLTLAIAESLAVCDYHFQLSASGNFSVLRTRDSLALVKLREPGDWSGYVKEGTNTITVTNSSGTETYDVEDVPKDLRSRLDILASKAVSGIKIFKSEESDAALDLNGNSVNVKYEPEIEYDHEVKQSYKLILNNGIVLVYMEGSAFGLDHVLLHEYGPVVIIDNSCRVRILPLRETDYELRMALKYMMNGLYMYM